MEGENSDNKRLFEGIKREKRKLKYVCCRKSPSEARDLWREHNTGKQSDGTVK